MTKLKVLGSIALFAGLAQCSFASSVYDICTGLACTFGGTGFITVTGPSDPHPGQIQWKSDVGAQLPNFFTMAGGVGAFAGVSGQESIVNLDNSVNPVDGAGFAPMVFMSFPTTGGSLPSLDINFIYAGLDDNGCTGAVSNCTPLISPGHPGPFNFQNAAGGGSTATFVLGGITHDLAATWTATFTVQFPGETYSQVLNDLGTTGHVTQQYSQGTVVITSATPEPGSVLMIGSGLLGLGIFLRKRVKRVS